jgi:hypothetical protein
MDRARNEIQINLINNATVTENAAAVICKKLPAMQRGMIELMKTDNPRNKADQKQDDAPLGNNQGCHSHLHWCRFTPVLNCCGSLAERP